MVQSPTAFCTGLRDKFHPHLPPLQSQLYTLGEGVHGAFLSDRGRLLSPVDGTVFPSFLTGSAPSHPSGVSWKVTSLGNLPILS